MHQRPERSQAVSYNSRPLGARVAELVDAADSKSAALKSVSVRLRPRAPRKLPAYLCSPTFTLAARYRRIGLSMCAELVGARKAGTHPSHIKSAADSPETSLSA